MIQKLFHPSANQLKIICVVLLCVGIIIFCSTNLLAQGLTPPPPSTERYVEDDINNNPIVSWIKFFINWLAVFIVVGSVIAIAVAGIQYSAAAGDSGKIAEAKKRIINVLVALLAYFFLFAFIQWLVPGGII